MMQSIEISEFGGPEKLKLVSVPIPHIESKMLLIKVHMSSVNPLDCRIREGYLRQFTGAFPMRLGIDVAGEVVSVGDHVKHFRVGNRVLAKAIDIPGGAYAQYILLPERACSHIPSMLDYCNVAGLPHAGLTALQALRDCLGLRAGESILINGGSGGVGHLALQLSKIMCAEVTVTCSSSSVEWMTILGADRIIDYHKEDLSAFHGCFDTIFDVAGQLPWEQAKVLLKPRGRYVTTQLSPKLIANSFYEYFASGRSVQSVVVRSSRMDMDYLMSLVVNQKLRQQSDRSFPLTKMVQAHRYQEKKKGVGKILIEVAH